MSAKSYCPVANVWCFWSKVLESNVTLLTGTVICITFHDKSLSRHLVWSSVIDCHLQIYGLGGWNGFNFCPFLPMDCRNQLGFLYCWCVGGMLLIDAFHSSVIKLQSQNSGVLQILIYTRLKINKKINLCTSFLPRSMFRFESRAFSQCMRDTNFK